MQGQRGSDSDRRIVKEAAPGAYCKMYSQLEHAGSVTGGPILFLEPHK